MTTGRTVGQTEFIETIMPISPWVDSAEITSPDGQHTARIQEASEVGMGAPTSGELRLDGGPVYDSCNPSMVWSDDSKYFAVPQWTNERKQRLLVVRISPREHRYAPNIFRVLELHSFEDGVIRGVDSPVYLPGDVVVDIRELNWT